MFGDLDYSGLGAPGLDSLAQFTTPSYIESPPHRIALQYGAPGIFDGGLARSKFHFGPPNRIAMCYGEAAGFRLEVGKTYNVKGELYSLNPDASLNVTPLSGSIYTLQPNDPRYSSAYAAIKAQYGSQGSSSSGSFWDQVKGFFTSKNAAAVTNVLSSGQGGSAAEQPPPTETFWDKYGTAIMIASGVAGAGLIVWGISSASRDDASTQVDRLLATRENRKKSKGKKKAAKSSKSAKRKSSPKSGRR